MQLLTIRKCFFIVLVIHLFACSSPLNNSDVGDTDPVVTITSPSSELVSQETPNNSSTTTQTTSTILVTPTSMATPISAITQTLNVFSRNECPEQVALDSLPLWSEGSILFTVEETNVWAISVTSLEPRLVYVMPDSPGSVMISDNAIKLLFLFERINVENKPEQEIIIYDLVRQEEIRSFKRSGSWSPIWEWLPDGRIKFLEQIEQTNNGEEREFTLLDPQTQKTETIVEKLDLPGYVVNETVLYNGIASLDPTGQIVLYTALTEQGNEVILRNLQNNAIVWRQLGSIEGFAFPKPGWPTADPYWDSDGKQVLFSAFVPEIDGGDLHIYSLMRDGQLTLPPLQLFPMLDKRSDWTIRYLSRSPGGRYLHYSLGKITGTIDAPPSNFEGPGYILDTDTLKLGEICDNLTSFLDARWVSENLLLYRVRHEDGGYSLQVLDTVTWIAQEIMKTEPGSEISSIGWTPVEFP
jgi:hypothetical protein